MSAASPTRITLVHSPACHLCDDAQEALRALADSRRAVVQVVSIDSPTGRALVAAHRPAMNPLVLVDDRFFSAGRLPRKKLLRLLEGRARERGVGVSVAGR